MHALAYTLENGISVPSHARGWDVFFYPWTGIAVGQSVFVPEDAPRISAKRHWRFGKKFVYAHAVKNGVHGKRFWRVK